MKNKENEAREEKATQMALNEKLEQAKSEKKELIKLLSESQVCYHLKLEPHTV